MKLNSEFPRSLVLRGITDQQSWESILGGSRSHLYLHAGASVAGFIVDFYCHKSALVVEVDGDVHDLQQEEDARREKVLSALGLRIVRFRNDEVVMDATRSAVMRKIRKLIAEC